MAVLRHPGGVNRMCRHLLRIQLLIGVWTQFQSRASLTEIHEGSFKLAEMYVQPDLQQLCAGELWTQLQTKGSLTGIQG